MKFLLAGTNPLDTLWLVELPETYLPKLRELLRLPPTIKQKFSEIVLHEGLALKKIRPQKPADYFRRAFRSQARREAEGARWMREHGIEAPRIHGYGINLLPWGDYDSLILMEKIECQGSLRTFLKESDDISKRREVLLRIHHDLQIFKTEGKSHKDAHYGNILLENGKTAVWIDNDLSDANGTMEWARKLIRSPLIKEEEQAIFSNLLPGHESGQKS